jgi:hypothetical protein
MLLLNSNRRGRDPSRWRSASERHGVLSPSIRTRGSVFACTAETTQLAHRRRRLVDQTRVSKLELVSTDCSTRTMSTDPDGFFLSITDAAQITDGIWPYALLAYGADGKVIQWSVVEPQARDTDAAQGTGVTRRSPARPAHRNRGNGGQPSGWPPSARVDGEHGRTRSRRCMSSVRNTRTDLRITRGAGCYRSSS